MIKHILKELPVYWQKSKPIAKRYHVPTAFIFADRLWSRAVYGALSSDVSEDYNTFTFYRLSSLARRDLYTSGRYRTSCKWFFAVLLRPFDLRNNRFLVFLWKRWNELHLKIRGSKS